jgi:tRNA threonylcarbamoyladenosine biosynthesis protein TsaE
MRMISESAAKTIKIAERLGKSAKPGFVICLTGELGCGKTTFVKGLALGLGIKDARYLNSPSFVILKEYRGRLPLYHFDVYRLNGENEFAGIGPEEYFYSGGVSVVEWADKVPGILPESRLEIRFRYKDEKTRELVFKAKGKDYRDFLENFS